MAKNEKKGKNGKIKYVAVDTSHILAILSISELPKLKKQAECDYIAVDESELVRTDEYLIGIGCEYPWEYFKRAKTILNALDISEFITEMPTVPAPLVIKTTDRDINFVIAIAPRIINDGELEKLYYMRGKDK